MPGRGKTVAITPPKPKAPTMPLISRLETFSNEFVAFVRVTCDDGSHGWGQTSPL